MFLVLWRWVVAEVGWRGEGKGKGAPEHDKCVP